MSIKADKLPYKPLTNQLDTERVETNNTRNQDPGFSFPDDFDICRVIRNYFRVRKYSKKNAILTFKSIYISVLTKWYIRH